MSATVVFSIAEIVRMICAFLEDDKQSLFSLVCCNRAASETALDVLWAKLDSIEPFIPFIPGRLLEACSVSTKCGSEPGIRELTCSTEAGHRYQCRSILSIAVPSCRGMEIIRQIRMQSQGPAFS